MTTPKPGQIIERGGVRFVVARVSPLGAMELRSECGAIVLRTPATWPEPSR
jgi:hypothetical protein